MHSYRTGGLKDKYMVIKVDGTKTDDNAYYFPLRLDTDPHARFAALAYANHVYLDNPVLAQEIRNKLSEFEGEK